MKRWMVVGAVAVLVVAGLGAAAVMRARRASAGASELQTAQVRRGSLAATVSSAGAVQSAAALDLSFLGSGQVKEVKVKEGDQVTAGQELASLDSADAELQVALAQLGLDDARAQLEKTRQGASADEVAAAQASLASAEESLKALQAGPPASDVELSRLRYEQAKDQLWSTQIQRDATCGNSNTSTACDQANASVSSASMGAEMARIQYEQAQQGASDKDLRAAEAQVAQARLNLSTLTAGPGSSDLALAENQVKQAEISLQQANLKLAQTRLVAPFDGTITGLALEVGQTVGASTQAATLAGSGGLEVVADLSEIDVASIKEGQQAEIVLDALPGQTFTGRVVDVARTGTSTQGVVNFPVRIALEAADAGVKPGMTANVSIVVDQRENVLLAPSRAIQTQGPQHVVRVLDQGQIVEVPVQIGLSGTNGTEILGDTLREGDVLVLNGGASSGGSVRAPGGMGFGAVLGRRPD